MKRLLLSSILLFTAAGAVHAADVVPTEPAPEVAPSGFSWSGGYAGVQGGYLRGTTSVDYTTLPFFSDPDPDRFTGGLYAGYNYQFQNGFVGGIEGDAALSNAKGRDAGWDAIGPIDEDWASEVNWTAAIRARAGYAIDRTLLYVAGGVAFAGVELAVFESTVLRDRIPDTLTGWTIGIGAEQAIMSNLIARLEYRYSDFGTSDYPDIPNTMPLKINYQMHDVRLGLAYKF